MKVNFRFVDYGQMHLLEENALAVDVQSRHEDQLRYFDHHRSSGFFCSAEVLVARIGELDSLRQHEEIFVYCHRDPDLDSAVSIYLALFYLRHGQLPPEDLLDRLIRITGSVDQGFLRPLLSDDPGHDFNFYSIFLHLSDFIAQHSAPAWWNSIQQYLESALAIRFDAGSWWEQFLAYSLVWLEECRRLHPACGPYLDVESGTRVLPALDSFAGLVDESLGSAFQALHDFIAKRSREERLLFSSALASGRFRRLQVHVQRADGSGSIVVPALAGSGGGAELAFLKAARGREFKILLFQPVQEFRRFIISIDPEDAGSFSLKGLGLALDRKNHHRLPERISRYYRSVDGREEPDPLFDRSPDPWYDGRGYNFTIVDSPAELHNRRLSLTEVLSILASDWFKLAKEYDSPAYRRWLGNGASPVQIPNKNEIRKDATASLKEFYERHRLFPLMGLLPLQQELHFLSMFQGLYADGETSRPMPGNVQQALEFLRTDIPQLSDSLTAKVVPAKDYFNRLRNYFLRYKQFVQSSSRFSCRNFSCPESSTCLAAGGILAPGWCVHLPYCPWEETGRFPLALKTHPSAFDLLDHQLQWLTPLLDSNNDTRFIKHTIMNCLFRFLLVRDMGKSRKYIEDLQEEKNTREKVVPEGFHFLVDHRMAGFCSAALQFCEELCLHDNGPLNKIEAKLLYAHSILDDGWEIKDTLLQLGDGGERFRLFAPLLANIAAFMESIQSVLHGLVQKRDDDLQVLMEQLLFLKDVSENPLAGPSFADMHARFMHLRSRQKNIFDRQDGETQALFSYDFWTLCSLGPRFNSGLFIAKLVQLWENYEFAAAEKYARLAKKTLSTSTFSFLRRFIFKKNTPLLFIPIVFALGMNLLEELDFDLWNKIARLPLRAIGLLFFLLAINLVGTFWLIRDSGGSFFSRLRKAFKLFSRLLIGSTLVPATLTWAVFHDVFDNSLPALFFLMLNSLFVVVVLDTLRKYLHRD